MANQPQTSLTDPLEERHTIEQRGLDLAKELEIDERAYLVASNLHWTFTLMRTLFERGPLAEENLSMSGFVTLWVLRMSGEMEGREVAAEVGIARSSFSGLANRLERRDLIQRRRHPGDGRAVLFSLTEAGRVVLERVWPNLNRSERQLSSHLGPSGQEDLADALRSVSDRISTLLQDGAPDEG